MSGRITARRISRQQPTYRPARADVEAVIGLARRVWRRLIVVQKSVPLREEAFLNVMIITVKTRPTSAWRASGKMGALGESVMGPPTITGGFPDGKQGIQRLFATID
jgi:hypothetical protein